MKQISIVARRNEYITTRIAELLGSRGINIETLDVEAVDDMSVITLTTDKYDEALEALREAGLDAVSEDALLILVPDEPGSLAKIAMRFQNEEIHLRSLRILRRRRNQAIVAVSVDRTRRAMEILSDLIISEERLRNRIEQPD